MSQPVFISHSSRDKDLAQTLCQHLEAQGIRCWIAPRDVPPGAKWAEAIIHGIESSVAIVLIFSKHVNASEQVMNEVERAMGNKKPIFPLRLDNATPSQELEYFISRRHWLDVSAATVDTTAAQLADAIRPLNATEAPPRFRGAKAPPESQTVFVLEASRQGEQLKLSAHEHRMGQEPPVKHYEHIAVPFGTIQAEAETLATLLNQAVHRHGELEDATSLVIKKKGASLYSQLLTSDIQQQLRATTATFLVLAIDDALVQIPWELLFDGHTFLCRRFSMGRIVSTQQPLVAGQRQPQAAALKMLVVADPQGNLNAAAREGHLVRDELAAERDALQIEVLTSPVGLSQVTQRLDQYDVLHYAGHANYDVQHPAQSGWLMADGTLISETIRQLGDTAPMPALVFCNSCRSGQTAAWDSGQEAGQAIYGLANAFLLAGAQHYIGTCWDVPDELSCTFAIDFYRQLAGGVRVGEALRSARQALAERDGEASVVWASYVLYGDPTGYYLDVPPLSAPTPEVSIAPPSTPLGTSVKRLESRRPSLQKSRVAIGAGILLLLVSVVIARWWPRSAPAVSPLPPAYQALEQGDLTTAETRFQQFGEQTEQGTKSQGYVGLAAVAFARGDYPQALNLADQADSLDPEMVYSHVIRGNVLLNQGKITKATAAYRAATEKTNGAPWQKAVAYDRLGRIYADQGEAPKALDHYDKAIRQRQNSAVAYANKAHLLEKLGKRQEALALYRQAQQIDPQDALATTLLQEAERRQQLTEDKERQQRIDQLVADLLQTYKEGTRRESPGDDWTSLPLTLAFLDFRRQGTLAARAGEEDFLRLRITQALQADGRMTILERELLDQLLAELKLSTSELVDPQVALRLGKILAARLIATGSFARFGEAGQLNVRLIETETTRIKASAAEIAERPAELNNVVEQVVNTLLTTLRQAYPLQARIIRVTPEGLFLNIGAEHGVAAGLIMQVFGKEEPLEIDGTVVGYDRTSVGFIEVTRVEARFAQAKVLQLEQDTTLQQGWKVKEVQEN